MYCYGRRLVVKGMNFPCKIRCRYRMVQEERTVQGTRVPGKERSRERMFQGMSSLENESSRERMVPRTKLRYSPCVRTVNITVRKLYQTVTSSCRSSANTLMRIFSDCSQCKTALTRHKVQLRDMLMYTSINNLSVY